MFNFYKPKSYSLLGIDINYTSVQILEISFKNNQYCIEAYAHSLLPKKAYQGIILKNKELVSDCLKKTLLNVDSTCKQANLALSDSDVTNTIIQISNLACCTEIKEFALIEATKRLAQPLNYDFKILGQSKKNSALMDLLVVAVPVEHINSKLDLIDSAGLKTNIVEIESFAILRAAQRLIQNIAPKSHIITVFFNLQERASYAFIFQGTDLMNSRAEQISFPTNLQQTSSKEFLLQHIKRTLQFFYSSAEHEQVDEILLAGSLASNIIISNCIQQQLNINTSIANPLTTLSLSTKLNPELLIPQGPLLFTACGLALRNPVYLPT